MCLHKINIILFFYLITLCVFSQNSSQYSIKQLSTYDGLSHNEVTSITQDKYGFIWVGTRGGLNRYDGYNFVEYDEGFGSINPSIERLFIDSDNNIWIGTKSGSFIKYDSSLDALIDFQKEKLPNRILAFGETIEGNILAGSWYNGVIEINNDSIVRHFEKSTCVNCVTSIGKDMLFLATEKGLLKKTDDDRFVLVEGIDEHVTSVVLDKDSTFLWIVGWGYDLLRYNYQNGTIKHFILPDIESDNAQTYSICNAANNTLWIGTWGNGLYKFDKITEQFNQIKVAANSNVKIHSVILDVYEDVKGDIWVGTNGGGLLKLSEKKAFNTVSALGNSKIPFNSIRAMAQDNELNYWVGTDGEGIFKSSDLDNFYQCDINSSDYSARDLISRKIFLGKDNTMWFLQEGGIFISKKENSDARIIRSEINVRGIDLRSIKKINDILITKEELWIATQQEGLYYFKSQNGSYQLNLRYHKDLDACAIKSNRITSIDIDKNKELIVSTYDGIYILNKANYKLEPLNHILANRHPATQNIILSACSDKEQNLWFGTPSNLLKLYYINDELKLKVYDRYDGLSDDYIHAVICDNLGDIWCSTNKGLSKLNTTRNNIVNYNYSDGITRNTFLEDGCFKDHSGKLFFITLSDITYFDPIKIVDKNVDAGLVISDFKILNKSVSISESGILKKNINDVTSLVFTHKEKEFSFELASLDFRSPEQNNYAYWLEGFNDDWIKMGSRRHISFSNLQSGDYKLHLRATNSHGEWSNFKRVIEITVLPPPWKTPLAIAGYVILILIIVASISFMVAKQERLKGDVKIQQVYRDQENLLHEQKIRFFTDISHEIRTPLTLIVGPINELKKQESFCANQPEIKKRLDVVTYNAERLLLLVNQLLEFRKIEVATVSLKVSANNMNEFIETVSSGFRIIAEQKNIDFEIKNDNFDEEVYFDKERLNIVLYNILSNAFKFTDANGRILLKTFSDNGYVVIQVIDSGPGMNDEDIKNIFNRFYQSHSNKGITGSGIGMSLVKKYVELHSGQIDVVSDPNKGSTFTVKLKKGKSHYDNNNSVLVSSSKIDSLTPETLPSLNSNKKASLNTKTFGSKILIADDNPSILDYLNDLLNQHYEVICATDGKEALQKAVEYSPDIIVADVMMPNMDGYELCKEIKTNERLMHIPVVLLTAKSTDDDKLFGKRKGANAYITKPFLPDMLLETVKQILADRKNLRDLLSKKIIIENTDIEIDDQQAAFIEKAKSIIVSHLSDSDFKSVHLANNLAMSHSTLYRNIKEITKLTPGEFIKSVKFSYAARLLVETKLTVSEIAEKIGYSDIKSFRKKFTERFKLTPTEYRSSKV